MKLRKNLEEVYDEKVLVNTTLAKGRLLIEETVLGLTPYASKFLIKLITPNTRRILNLLKKNGRNEKKSVWKNFYNQMKHFMKIV